MNTWPKHADGRNKTMGEMTAEEQREQMILACSRMQSWLNNPKVKKAIADVLSEGNEGSGA